MKFALALAIVAGISMLVDLLYTIITTWRK